MQWDKVKNILISILLAVDLFLLGSLGLTRWREWRRATELENNLRTLLSGYGQTLAPSFSLPEDQSLLPLSLDRSRASEETMATALLGSGLSRTEKEDGAVLFESSSGTLEWNADGTVNGVCTISELPGNEQQAQQQAERLLESWGITDDNIHCTVSGLTVTASGPVAGQPVHNRQLVLHFGADSLLTITGRWSFGRPYTGARENSTACIAADALLSFAAGTPEPVEIQRMEAGYYMEADSSRRLQLIPTWKIVTGSGVYFVDCAKKTAITPEN